MHSLTHFTHFMEPVTIEIHAFYFHFQNGLIFENNMITTEFWQQLQLTTVNKKCTLEE